ncbi:MAG TPA: STAS domain-containing protein [Ardenticatenaceae bacterium]|nr:STAS domain-containing protein [Ardenticatenaceae bacterium]
MAARRLGGVRSDFSPEVMGGIMELEHIALKRSDVFRVSGRIDSSNAQQFQDALFSAINNGRCNLVVNLSGLTYISSAGIRALIAALKSCSDRTLQRGGLHLAETPEYIKEVFDLAGLTPIFSFYDTELEAVGDF